MRQRVGTFLREVPTRCFCRGDLYCSAYGSVISVVT